MMLAGKFLQKVFALAMLWLVAVACSQVVGAEADIKADAKAAQASLEGPLVKWHPHSLSFPGPDMSELGLSPNPFLDFRLQVKLVAPSGRVLRVPGFFDGDGQGGGQGNIWRIRFSPDEAGEWRYRASFREGVDVALSLEREAGRTAWFDGWEGSFIIAARDPSAPGFLKWGRLDYVNAHYLKFVDGPFWIKGGVDSPENFLGYKGFDNTFDQGNKGILHEYAAHIKDWRPGDPLFVSADTQIDSKGIIGALNYLAGEGVNSIYFLPLNLGGDGQDSYPFVGPENTSFDKTHYDISKLYQWNRVLGHAQERGLALNIVFGETEAANEQWLDGGTLGRERKLFYREMIARFGYLLAVKWNLSEETSFPPELRRSFADYISALDWAGHPLTFHTPVNKISVYGSHLGEARFDATSVQYDPQRASRYVETLRAASAGAGRPWVVDMDENNPSGNALSDRNASDLRKRALYNIYFSGGSLEWYFGSFRLPLGGDQSTEDFRTRAEMYRYMRHARLFLERHIPFWAMEPDDSLLLGKDLKRFPGGQVFQRPGEVYAVYLPEAKSGGFLKLEDGSYEKRWFNPRTGLFEGAVELASGGLQALGAPPFETEEDWVLLFSSRGNHSPSVTFLEPAAMERYSSGVGFPVRIFAEDRDGEIESLRLYINGALVAQKAQPPFSWDEETIRRVTSDGTQQILAVVRDNEGAEASAAITLFRGEPSPGNEVPVLRFAEPLDGERLSLGEDIRVRVHAADAGGRVVQVALFLNGALVRRERSIPYQWGSEWDEAFTGLPAGSHELMAVALDDRGGEAKSVVTFVID